MNVKSDKLQIVNKRMLKNILFLKNRLRSQHAFAKFTNIGQRTVLQWYVKDNPPSLTTQHLTKISNAFKISIHDLVRSDISKMKPIDLRTNYYIVQELLKQ